MLQNAALMLRCFIHFSLLCVVQSLLCVSSLTSGLLDPEVCMTTIEIIEHWGYAAEIVHVTTEDGYILELHRILGLRNKTRENTSRPIVLMQHGLISASDVWVGNLPNQSAGFMFSDAGFDVWLANSRGNTYSRKHKRLKPCQRKFWEFSWDHLAKYDLEASIDAILAITGQEFLYYIGHSQGTTILFGRNSENPNLKAKHFALCPVTTFKHIKGLIALMAKSYPVAMTQERYFGSTEALPSDWRSKLITTVICAIAVLGSYICSHLLFSAAGPDTKQLNGSRTPVYLSHLPAGSSRRNMLHWFQLYRHGKTQKFDVESEEENLHHYGQPTPPHNLSRINIDTYLYWSDVDWLATTKDIKEGLLPYLNPDILKQNNRLENFNHMDFIWGLRAGKELYQPIIAIIRDDWNSIQLT